VTGFFKEKAVGQVDAILIDSQVFGVKQIKELLKGVEAEPLTKSKKGKKK